MPHSKSNSKNKAGFHHRNKHKERYHFEALVKSYPELKSYVFENKYGDQTVDFFNPEAVKALNKALLIKYYSIENWDIPRNYLCPPIPGRADYIHHMADLLSGPNSGKTPKGDFVKCLDIGVGANCIYPILGISEYGWSFVGSDVDEVAIKNANKIVTTNIHMNKLVQLRLQKTPEFIFTNTILENEYYDLTICNPPFHESMAEAKAGTLRKLKNLKKSPVKNATTNFGGQGGELWTPGGEKSFVLKMINESRKFSLSCFWFSTLISKKSNLPTLYRSLEKVGAKEVKTIDMDKGNKASRILTWTFLNKEKQQKWVKERWNS